MPTVLAARSVDPGPTTDLIVQEPAGQVKVLMMNGTTWVDSGFVSAGASVWRIVATGDFNGDSKPDLVWQYPEGHVLVWFLDGTDRISYGYVSTTRTVWRVAGAGDFNGDGKPDIVWQYPEGHVQVWLMDGTTMIGSLSLWPSPTEWDVRAVEDMDGDGLPDLIWQYPGGSVVVWYMDGAQKIGAATIFQGATAWHVSSAGDMDGDGRPDLIWIHPERAVIVWLMDGAVRVDGFSILTSCHVGLRPENPEEARISIVNHGPAPAVFELTLNGRKYSRVSDVLTAIASMPDEFAGEPAYRKAWRFMKDHYRHWVPLTASGWYHWPVLALNSAGFGYCDDAAAILAHIWRAHGFDARVWELYGHVVPEVFADGRWQLFDPDLRVYYTDEQGLVVGVERLERDPLLITEPWHPLPDAMDNAYSEEVAALYTSTIDNRIAAPEAPIDGVLRFALPPQASLEFPLSIDETVVGYEGSPVPSEFYRHALLTLPAGWTGSIGTPLIVHAIEGKGTVQIGEEVFDMPSQALDDYIAQRPAFAWEIDVLASTAPVKVTYFISPIVWQLGPLNVLSLEGWGWLPGLGIYMNE